jgi:hypothetical protein
MGDTAAGMFGFGIGIGIGIGIDLGIDMGIDIGIFSMIGTSFIMREGKPTSSICPYRYTISLWEATHCEHGKYPACMKMVCCPVGWNSCWGTVCDGRVLHLDSSKNSL